MSTRYRAFLSYSHRDRRVALWLHRALERYRVPAKLVGSITALMMVHRAEATSGAHSTPELPARAAITEGLIHTAAGDVHAGLAAYERALHIYRECQFAAGIASASSRPRTLS